MIKKEYLQKTAADFMAPIRSGKYVAGKGALIGGAIGASLGALKKPKREGESRLQNAAIGGMMGAGVGMAGGHLLHTSKPGSKLEDKMNQGIDKMKETNTYKNVQNKYKMFKNKREFGHLDDYKTLMKDRKTALTDEEIKGFRSRIEKGKAVKELKGYKEIGKQPWMEQVTDKRGFFAKRYDKMKEKMQARKERKNSRQEAKERLEKVDTRTGKIKNTGVMQQDNEGFRIVGKKTTQKNDSGKVTENNSLLKKQNISNENISTPVKKYKHIRDLISPINKKKTLERYYNTTY